MASGALSSHDSAYGAGRQASHAPRVDDFWLALVGSVDAVLRSLHGIYEFTDDPECVLRVALTRARHPVILSDGTRIADGEPIGALHLWNEHLPAYSERGPDLAWASDIRRRVLHSMRLLAAYVEREPAWRSVPAFSAATTLSNRLGDTQIRRLAARHGFERIEPPRSLVGKLHALGDCFNTWALTRAFNPAALSRQPFLRGRYELWISRSVLLGRYGTARQPAGLSPIG
jgi:YkoP-like protein